LDPVDRKDLFLSPRLANLRDYPRLCGDLQVSFIDIITIHPLEGNQNATPGEEAHPAKPCTSTTRV
jgi:hypothetical protein